MASKNRLRRAIADYPGPTDHKINCHGRQFDVHKAVMCASSRVFLAELSDTYKEGKEGVSELKEFDADTVERMIAFAYLADYEVEDLAAQIESLDIVTTGVDTTEAETSEEGDNATKVAGEGLIPNSTRPDKAAALRDQLLAHIRMWAVGNYYNILKLCTFATQQFVKLLKAHWLQTLTPTSLIPIMEEIATHTLRQDDIRTALYDILADTITDLGEDHTFISVLGATEGLHEFAADLLPCAGERLVKLRRENDNQADRIAALERELKIQAAQCNESALNAQRAQQFAEERLEHAEKVMENLVEDLEDLPDECKSSRCNAEFGKLRVERKGDSRFGYGNYWIKCGRRRCGCRLNK